MNVQTAKAARIPTTAITALIVDAMIKIGVSAADAVKIAELMLEADLIGADAHGVFRLPQYITTFSPSPRPAISRNSGTANISATTPRANTATISRPISSQASGTPA